METPDLPDHRRSISRRALVGWGIAGSVLAASGICSALSRAFCFPWSRYTSTDLYTYEGQAAALAWSPDGTKIAAGIDNTVQIWESATGQRLVTYTGHPQNVLSVSWSPDGTRLVSADLEGGVQVWQASDGKLLWMGPDPPPSARGVWATAAWSPNGAWIAATVIGADVPPSSMTSLWDATHGTLIRRLADWTLYTQQVAWSPESTRLATGGNPQSVAAWDAGSAQKIWSYQGDSAYVEGLAWSPDGTRLASCGNKPIVLFASNGGVRIWDATSGRRVLTYWGHSSQVDLWALAWSPNGKFIASGGTDQVAQVWVARTGERVLTYRGHVDQPRIPGAYPYAIRALAWSPDSTRIVSSAISGPIHVWTISEC